MDTKKQPTHQTEVSINVDTTPIYYTDNVHMTTNKYGVIFDVTQRIGNQTRIVTRIGMSREHAKQFAIELGKLLAITEGNSTTQ